MIEDEEDGEMPNKFQETCLKLCEPSKRNPFAAVQLLGMLKSENNEGNAIQF